MNIPYVMIFDPIKSLKEVIHAACRSNFDPLFAKKLCPMNGSEILLDEKTFELGQRNFEIVTVKSYSSTYERNFEIRRGFTFTGQLRVKFAIKF